MSNYDLSRFGPPDWYANQAAPQVANEELANQIANTPTRTYATRAGAGYGIDPNLIAGWFPMKSEISDMADQRNLDSLHTYGVPYAEQQSVLRDVQNQQATDTKLAAADQQAAMEQDILATTSFDAKALASKADLPVNELHAIVSDPGYQDAASTIDAIMQDPNADLPADPKDPSGQTQGDAAFQAYLDSLANDPALQRVLLSVYGG